MRQLLMGVLLGAGAAIAVRHVRRRIGRQQPPAERAAAPPSTARTKDAREIDPDDLASLSAAELYRRAQAAGIRGRAAMTKAQLIEALRERSAG
jgi:hypothetical protein